MVFKVKQKDFLMLHTAMWTCLNCFAYLNWREHLFHTTVQGRDRKIKKKKTDLSECYSMMHIT